MTDLLTALKISVILIYLLPVAAIAQEKEIAKVEKYILQARQATDPGKKADYYAKAAQLIIDARLPKSVNMKIADAYLEEGDINNAKKFYDRCDKEDKAEGYVKMGHKTIEMAFDDPKTEAKTMSTAMKYFTKGGAVTEGYEAIGDAYYDKGQNYYMKAAEYYALGKISAKIDKIAGEYAAAGNKAMAAEVYMKLETEEGFTKAGDLYYSVGDFNNAFTAYDKGGNADGIKKYADKLFSEGFVADANALYNKVVEMYAAKNNLSAIARLAQLKEERGEFGLAASFYEKAGEPNKSLKASAFSKLTSFDFEGAKADFNSLGDAEIIKAIAANMKYLTPLKDAAYYFDDVKQHEPPVTYIEDSVTHKKVPNSVDLEIFNEYYKAAIGAIVDNCYIVSANVPKITHAGIKDAFMKKFRQYGAIRNVLDASFGKRLQKAQVTAKDVVM